MTATEGDRRTVARYYGLRSVTLDEAQAEIDSLLRKQARGSLDDGGELLFAMLDLWQRGR